MKIINSEEELINKALKIESEEDRVKFITKYFFDTVQYDYAYLFAKGYSQESVSQVDNNYSVEINNLRSDGDEELVISRAIVKGESKIFNSILQIRDKNKGDYNSFVRELDSYITEQLNIHLSNSNIVEQEKNILMEKIISDMKKKFKSSFDGNEYLFNYDISSVLINYWLEAKEQNFPTQIENGLLKKGVCEDYANYLTNILTKARIEAHTVVGTSELKHAWNIVKVDNEYKSIDLTRAIFIRDGFKGIPENQIAEEWLYSSMENIFKMQDTRTISEIDGNELTTKITAKNYNEYEFKKLMSKDESLKSQEISYVPLDKVIECPEEYIIPECQSACEAFWNKGIETFMVSNDDDGCLYVLVINLSEYNENRMKKMMEKYPDHYYFDSYRETYGICVPDKSEESVEKLKVLTAPFKMQDTTRYKTPDVFLDEYIHKDGLWKIVENNYVQEVNPKLANSTFEEALVATNKAHLYVPEEGKVYDNELFKSWHDRYLKFSQENPALTDKCDELKNDMCLE